MACSSMKACCTGVRAGVFGSLCWRAYQAGRPSRVVTARLPTADKGVTHDRVSAPSINTEHDPHCARPHPKRGPFNCSSPESTYSSGVSCAALIVHMRSFTLMRTPVAIFLHSLSGSPRKQSFQPLIDPNTTDWGKQPV